MSFERWLHQIDCWRSPSAATVQQSMRRWRLIRHMREIGMTSLRAMARQAALSEGQIDASNHPCRAVSYLTKS